MMRILDSPLEMAISHIRSKILKDGNGWKKEFRSEILDDLQKFMSHHNDWEHSVYVQGFHDGYKTKNSKDHDGKINRRKDQLIGGRQDAVIQGEQGYILRRSHPVE